MKQNRKGNMKMIENASKMSYATFIGIITRKFGENARVRNDRENGRYVCRYDEWLVIIGHSSRRALVRNLRNRKTYTEDWSEEVVTA